MKALLWNVGLPLALFAVFAIIDACIRVWWRKRRLRRFKNQREKVFNDLHCAVCLKTLHPKNTFIHYCQVHVAMRLCLNCNPGCDYGR